MEKSGKQEQRKKTVTEVKIFLVPFALEEIKENISISTNTPSKISKEKIIKQAFNFHSQGNTPEAAKSYQYFIDQGFKDYRVFSNYGVILQNIGKLKAAKILYHKAIELNPNYSDAHLNLGNVLKDLGKLEEAEFSTRKAIELNPNYALAHLNLGNILSNLGKLKEAELSTRKAIELNPDYAEAHSNLGYILRDIGKLKEAEISTLKAIKLDPKNKSIENNLINLLTVYKPKIINSDLLYIINDEFRSMSLRKIKYDYIIDDEEAIYLYKNGLEIYRKYNLELETSLSQIWNSNEDEFNCKRHKLIFNQYKVIPEFCFGCYKVQVQVDSIIELIKVFMIFSNIELDNNNTRKCMIELRPNISGFYKGIIYCLDLTDALVISKKLDVHLQNNIRIALTSKVKRGCSEYALEFPKYKDIEISDDQPMNYNEKWRSIEKNIDKEKKHWGKANKTIEGFNLNNFLIIRNWIAYAQRIGDQSVNKITNEQIKYPENFNDVNRDFHSI